MSVCTYRALDFIGKTGNSTESKPVSEPREDPCSLPRDYSGAQKDLGC